MMDRDILGWNIERLPKGQVREVILLKPKPGQASPTVVMGGAMEAREHARLPPWMRWPDSKKVDIEGYLDALDDAEQRQADSRDLGPERAAGRDSSSAPGQQKLDTRALASRSANNGVWTLTGGLAHRRWVRGGG